MEVPFSSHLGSRFYNELLHLIGLTEINRGGRKTVVRKPPQERHSGALLEETITQLQRMGEISLWEESGHDRGRKEEWVFDVALELCTTWISRILFLKLLEAQLVRYHKRDQSYAFLSLDKIKNYGDLNRLFFEVLARKYDERKLDIKFLFENVPYLNFSLFGPTALEGHTLMISDLADDSSITVFSSTVLGEAKGERREVSLSPLEYLLGFLNAYDFGLEGSGEEGDNILISPTFLRDVLGRVRHYKDEACVIPSFISRFMSRQVIRKAVIQKFNDSKNWKCQTLAELHLHIKDHTEANQIINSIKICDPTVGSGDFLLSALKELIAVKSELRILQDLQGRPLKNYHVEVVDDDLLVMDVEGRLFEYQPFNKESQRVQEAIFHEKKKIIDKCLFGVGVDNSAVEICRWTLGVELLGSAYYKELDQNGSNASPVCYANSPDLRPEFLPRRELQILPNMDMNIRCGNSLFSRFALDLDLSLAIRKSKWTLESYRAAVEIYRNAEDNEHKREINKLISEIKEDWSSTLSTSFVVKENSSQINEEDGADMSLSEPKEAKPGRIKTKESTTREIRTEGPGRKLDEFRKGKIKKNSFEWLLEFPEVLNEKGHFIGFDVVLGNPPAVRSEELTFQHQRLSIQYEIDDPAGNRFSNFFELSHRLLRKNGFLAFVNTAFDKTEADKMLRKYIVLNFRIEKYVGFESGAFDGCIDRPVLLLAQNSPPKESFQFLKVSKTDLVKDLLNDETAYQPIPQNQLESKLSGF